MKQKVQQAFEAYLAEDAKIAALPEIEHCGHPFTICTNGAKWIRDIFFLMVKLLAIPFMTTLQPK